MNKFVFVFCVFVGLLTAFVENNYACSCAFYSTPLSVHYSNANIVFIGKVTNVKKISYKMDDENATPNRMIEFEIKKIYKGLAVATKRVSLKTRVGGASCGLDETPKKGEIWSVFVFKNDKYGLSYFGGTCAPSEKLENDSDISEFEKELLFIKEKQAIIGAVISEMSGESRLKNLEVTLEGEGQKFITTTDEKGLFYFPLKSPGRYKVTIKTPFDASIFLSTLDVNKNQIKEETNGSTKILGNLLTYEVQLKDNEFSYNELQLIIYRTN